MLDEDEDIDKVLQCTKNNVKTCEASTRRSELFFGRTVLHKTSDGMYVTLFVIFFLRNLFLLSVSLDWWHGIA